ncbi:MerR family transcriptional regulator [Spiractinospora alimapuensis]|uniref:MerR family transcriptional regulator n=1 Tax=Spiractinospora alimapuensis TaxID=2820884 RepID=UPI00374201D4|nr:MerR family transcriptional regulator [Spiractinospora alimapuensis]
MVRWGFGEVSRRYGIAAHVLWHWADVGVLPPDRGQAGRRRYYQRHDAGAPESGEARVSSGGRSRCWGCLRRACGGGHPWPWLRT